MKCFKCGVSSDRVLLYDVISSTGITKVCRKCSYEVNLPVIKKSVDFELNESRSKSNVRDVLVRMSGYKAQDTIKQDLIKQQDVVLQEVIKQNLPDIIKASPIPSNQFIDNFHWVIMRQRRLKKLTQKELAYEIRELEVAVKLSEQGIVSKQTPLLIEKLEKYLDVKLMKENSSRLIDEARYKIQSEFYPSKEINESLNFKKEVDLSFDPIKTKEVTIGELKSLREFKEDRLIRREEKLLDEPPITKEEKLMDEQDLSDKEIDDILFGRA